MEKVITRDSTILDLNGTAQAARVSFAAGVISLLSLAALHVLSPEFDPSWRMVSEYALGGYSWVLTLMFVTQAISSVALFLRSGLRSAQLAVKSVCFFCSRPVSAWHWLPSSTGRVPCMVWLP